jgi:peptidoglycan/xylan/chitin deacetylase (PgdA/CDA1 family)
MRSRVRRYVRARLERRSTRQAGLALVYHRIGEPPGDPRYELVPALSTRLFETQLKHLRTAYRVVPPSQLLDAALERRAGDRFPIALTFDDDLRSHVDIVGPALEQAGLPAAFFLCGASLDASHSFWWEDLQAIADRRDLPSLRLRSLPELDLRPVVRGVPYAIHRAAEAIERLARAKHDAVAAELRVLALGRRRRLAARDVAALAAAGFEIGFHTRRHYLLTTLDELELGTAMIEGREELETIIGRRLTMMAYPHGKASARVAEAARSADYEIAFTASPTCVGPATHKHMLGRAEVTSTPTSAFAQMVTLKLGDNQR